MAAGPKKAHTYVDRTVGLRGDLRCRILERPGRWMDDDALTGLVEDLRVVADRSVSAGELRYGVLSGRRDALTGALIVVLHDTTKGTPVGFSAMVLLDVTIDEMRERVLHAGLCIVAPEARSCGLAATLYAVPALLALVRNGGRPLWATNVSQVPAALGIFARGVSDVYPAPWLDAPPSAAHASVARELVARHRAVFGVGAEAELDPRTFVLRNAYTGGSDELKKPFSACAGHRDPEFGRMCLERLDYGRGDDFVQVGRLTPALAVRLLARFAGASLLRRRAARRAGR